MPHKRRKLSNDPPSPNTPSPTTNMDMEMDTTTQEQTPNNTITRSTLPADANISPTASLTYWTSTPSTVSGMLGGYPQVSRIDIAGSRAFLAKLRRLTVPSASSHNNTITSNTTTTTTNNTTLPQPPAKLRLIADCGAGIGRITTNFLTTVATHIDVIEPVVKFTDQLREEHAHLFVSSENTDPNPNHSHAANHDHDYDHNHDREAIISNIFNTPLETWSPPKDRQYDIFWNQWCLGHLPDVQLTIYLRRLIPNLAMGGFIVVKENLSTDSQGEDEFDEVDSSVTRSRGKFERIFQEAGLVVRKTEMQRGGFGRGLGLMPVRMWGLQPGEWSGDRKGEVEVKLEVEIKV